MNSVVLAMVCMFMAGTLFFSEHTERSISVQTASSGWFALGLLIRMMLVVVLIVLLSYCLSGL